MKLEHIYSGQELTLTTANLSIDYSRQLIDPKDNIVVVFQEWIIKHTQCIVIVPFKFIKSPETNVAVTKWVFQATESLFSPRYGYHEHLYADKDTSIKLIDRFSLEERLVIMEQQLDKLTTQMEELVKINEKLDTLVSHLVPEKRGGYY